MPATLSAAFHGYPACAPVRAPLSSPLRDSSVRITLRDLARLLALEIADREHGGMFDTETFTTRRLRPGESIVRAGDAFESLYAVRSGFFKTIALDQNGGEQVIGFPMIGDIIGIDGIDSNQHSVEVMALEHADVVIVPFGRLARLARICPALEASIYRAMSRELARERRVLWMLGSLHAEARVAAFLVSLSERYTLLGYSPTHFNLRMTRQEIGSYLGLKLETVSRALSHFARNGLARVQQKSIELLDLKVLREIAS